MAHPEDSALHHMFFSPSLWQQLKAHLEDITIHHIFFLSPSL